nr:hypothetical protein [Tanacetum cinerariifolium]
FSEEDKVGIIEHGLPKKICDPENYFLLVKINGIVEMVALVDTEASGIDVIDLSEEVGSSSEEVVKIRKANRNKGYNINKLTPPPSLRLEEIPPISTILP